MIQIGKDYDFLKDERILILKPPLNVRTQVPEKSVYEKAHNEIMDLIIKYKYPVVLSDCRGVKMDFSLWSIVEKTDLWRRLHMSKHVKVAVVLDEISEKARLRENRVFSYGFKVQGFTEWNKAMKWLKE